MSLFVLYYFVCALLFLRCYFLSAILGYSVCLQCICPLIVLYYDGFRFRHRVRVSPRSEIPLCLYSLPSSLTSAKNPVSPSSVPPGSAPPASAWTSLRNHGNHPVVPQQYWDSEEDRNKFKWNTWNLHGTQGNMVFIINGPCPPAAGPCWGHWVGSLGH